MGDSRGDISMTKGTTEDISEEGRQQGRHEGRHLWQARHLCKMMGKTINKYVT